jgi:hypothetical protein
VQKKPERALTEFERHALKVLAEHAPLISSEVGDKVWPGSSFKNPQGAALAGGGLMGRLRVRGLVKTRYEDVCGEYRCQGWVLTPEGRKALNG